MDIHRIARVKFTNPKNQVLEELKKARILGKNISPTLIFQNSLYRVKFHGNIPTGWCKSNEGDKEYIPNLPEFRHLKKVPLKCAKQKAYVILSFFVRRYLLYILFIILSSFVENWSLQQVGRIGGSKNGPNLVGANTQAARLSVLREEWPHRVIQGVSRVPLIPPLPKRISNYSIAKIVRGNPLSTLPMPLSLAPIFQQLYALKQPGTVIMDFIHVLKLIPIEYLGAEFLTIKHVSDTQFKNANLLFENVKKWQDTMLYLAQYSGQIADAANEACLTMVVEDLLGLVWLPPGVKEIVAPRIVPSIGYWLRDTDAWIEEQFKKGLSWAAGLPEMLKPKSKPESNLNQRKGGMVGKVFYREWAKNASRYIRPPPNELKLLISDRIRLYRAKKNKGKCAYDQRYIEEWAEKVKKYLMKTNINQNKYEKYNAARKIEVRQAYLKKAIDALIPFSSNCNIQNTNVNLSYIGKINNFVREHPTMYVKRKQHKEKLKNLVVCEKTSLLNSRLKCAPLKKSNQ